MVHPRSHQLRARCRARRVQRPVRRGDAARAIRPRRTRSCRATTPARSTPPHGLWRLSRIGQATARRCTELFDDSHPRILPRSSTQTDEGRAFLEPARRRTCTTSVGAATPSTTSPTCRGARTRRSRWATSPATSTCPTKTTPMIQYERAVKPPRGAHCQDPGQAGRRPRARSPSSTSSSRPPSTLSRSPRTTPSTSTRWASCVLPPLRASPSAIALGRDGRASTSRRRRVLPVPATRSATRWRTVATDAPRSPSAGRRSRPPRRRRRQVPSARRRRRRAGDFVDPFMDAIVTRLLGIKPPAGGRSRPERDRRRRRLARYLHAASPASCGRSTRPAIWRTARSWCAR